MSPLVFLSAEPPETHTPNVRRTTMLATTTSLRQLVREVGERVKCDHGSTVGEATRLITGAGNTAPEGGVRLPSKVSVAASAITHEQVLNLGSLAYVADCP